MNGKERNTAIEKGGSRMLCWGYITLRLGNFTEHVQQEVGVGAWTNREEFGACDRNTVVGSDQDIARGDSFDIRIMCIVFQPCAPFDSQDA